MHRRTLHKLRNRLQTALLVLGMAAIAAACAWTLWGATGVIWAAAAMALALVLSPGIPWSLTLRMYGARPLPYAAFPDGHDVLRALARRADLPAVPQLHYVPSPLLNAFAVGGRNSSAIAVTDGLLRALTLRELAGVLAHEVSHVANDDLRIMALADVMSRVTSALSYVGIALLALNLPLLLIGAAAVPWLLVLLLVSAPTLMGLLQLALSRAREYDADLDAARLSGDPAGLAAALAKLERLQGRFWEEILLPGRRMPDPSLLRTHPPTEERVRRLLELAEGERVVPSGAPAGPRRLPAQFARVRRAPGWRRWGYWY